MSKPLKLAKTYRLGHDKVVCRRADGPRIPSGEYAGIIDGAFANHISTGCDFSVKLPTNGFRRDLSCKILISPADVTVVVVPTLDQALSILLESLIVLPRPEGKWSCSITINCDKGQTKQYFEVGATPSMAVGLCECKARESAHEWYDADPSLDSGAEFVDSRK